MRYYREIKWFGGYNNNTGKYNDFGFITNIGDKKLEYHDIYFRENDVLFNKEPLQSGVLVTFDIITDSLKRLNAVKVDFLKNELNRDLLDLKMKSLMN